ncbi:uncharacterized protein LOC126562596 [Anopheles maculipalpis]|uniref:uncharacterized protein LOC126562596 n=1 Tax=Anopheles maculipalpis TaxID=1496333 RepID=UPI002159AD74|nr:uncharacterized protein LOC126562596 [Anopheles maculipalpis]
MRELINSDDIPPLPAVLLGTDDLLIQMSLVLVIMGMLLHGTSLMLDFFGHTSRVCQQMQLFTVTFGILLTTLGIITYQFAQELVLAVRVLAIIMLLSEAYLGLVIFMTKFKRLQRQAALYRQSGRFMRNEDAAVSYVRTYGLVTMHTSESMTVNPSDSYRYRVVQPGAATVNEIMSVNTPVPSLRSSVTDLPMVEYASVTTVDASVERAEMPQPNYPAPKYPPPSVSEVIDQDSPSARSETASTKRRAARKAFRLDPSVIRQPGEEPNEPVDRTSDQSAHSDKPLLTPNGNKTAIRPTTLNLPKTTFRLPCVEKDLIVPTVSRAIQTDTDEEDSPNTLFGEHRTSTIARRPPSGRDLSIYRNSEPIPSTSREEPNYGK